MRLSWLLSICLTAMLLPTSVLQADAANDLVITYWGGEVGNRRFDILVNGEKIAERTLHNDQPGQFFEVTYPVAEALTKGRSKVTVHFQAGPGAIAGGVFGARLLRRAKP
jgi:hypothetical protein